MPTEKIKVSLPGSDGIVDATFDVPMYVLVPDRIEGCWFQPPYTTVKWEDGTVTTVKCDDDDAYDPEKGMLLCFAKRLWGGGRYNDALRAALATAPGRGDTINPLARELYEVAESLEAMDVEECGASGQCDSCTRLSEICSTIYAPRLGWTVRACKILKSRLATVYRIAARRVEGR